MPRPTNKQALMAAIDAERIKLRALLDTLTPEEMVTLPVVGAWTVKDVLVHLTAWEQMCLGWIAAGERGEIPHLPALGFKWNQTPALNQQIYDTHRDDELADVLKRFTASFLDIYQLIVELSDEDMFTRGRYAWTRKNTLGTYLVSATSSHYAWAWKEIRKGLKQRHKAAVMV